MELFEIVLNIFKLINLSYSFHYLQFAYSITAIIPQVMRKAKVPTILGIGFELHHGFLGGLASSGVNVNAAGSSGSSGSMICLDSFFRCFSRASGNSGSLVKCQ